MEENWFHFDRQNLLVTVRLSGKKDLRITPDNAFISYFSGGPGGQNVNKNMNGVRLIYSIPDDYLNAFQKTRQLVTRSMNQRNREQNMRDAFEQLAEKIRKYFYVLPERKKTKVPKGSKESRIQGKKMRGKVKQDRKRVDY